MSQCSGWTFPPRAWLTWKRTNDEMIGAAHARDLCRCRYLKHPSSNLLRRSILIRNARDGQMVIMKATTLFHCIHSYTTHQMSHLYPTLKWKKRLNGSDAPSQEWYWPDHPATDVRWHLSPKFRPRSNIDYAPSLQVFELGNGCLVFYWSSDEVSHLILIPATVASSFEIPY